MAAWDQRAKCAWCRGKRGNQWWTLHTPSGRMADYCSPHCVQESFNAGHDGDVADGKVRRFKRR